MCTAHLSDPRPANRPEIDAYLITTPFNDATGGRRMLAPGVRWHPSPISAAAACLAGRAVGYVPVMLIASGIYIGGGFLGLLLVIVIVVLILR